MAAITGAWLTRGQARPRGSSRIAGLTFVPWNANSAPMCTLPEMISTVVPFGSDVVVSLQE
eukprot:4628885-Pyramimonas_sp.AAC.1